MPLRGTYAGSDEPAADIPIPPDLSRRYGGSSAGRDWLASLPRLIGHCLDQWQLELDLAPGALPWNGHGGHRGPGAAPCRHGADRRQRPRQRRTSRRPEGRLSARRSPRGTPRPGPLETGTARSGCWPTTPDAGALLLERLDADRSLQDVPMDEAVPVWGGLVRRLSLVPDGRPEWQEFDHVAARAEQWSDELPESWEQLGRPFPRWLLEAALEVCQTRGAVGRRSGKDVLVHTDLHYLNILARPGALGNRQGDGGEPADGWARDRSAAHDRRGGVRGGAVAVEPDRRAVPGGSGTGPAGALPGLQHGRRPRRRGGPAVEPGPRGGERPLVRLEARHEGDLARSLWVASTLAGRTLPELPAPHELPAPGEAAGGLARLDVR